jgi:two-component system cell cycle sensor histidine kinase/response regulator CckA
MDIIKKRDIFLIRLLVIIIISYLTIFGPIKDKQIFYSYIFIAFYLSTNLFLPYIPDRFFISRKIFYALVFFDSGMVSLGIYLSGHAGTDFYLVYFLILGLAAMNISLKYLMINTTVFVFLYGWILYQKNLLEGDLFVTYALRLPFMIIIALFFGYIVETIIKDREISMRESEEKYRQLFTTELDAIVIFDEETALVKDINDAALNLYGYDREEFLQLKSTDISANPGKTFHIKMEIIDGNTQNNLLQYQKKKDGTLFPAKVSSGTFLFQNRRMISTIIRDFSERVQAEEELEKHRHNLEDQVKKRTSQLASAVAKLKQEIEQRKQTQEALQESEEKYRTVLEVSPDPVVVYDMVGKVVYFNPAFTSIFGWTLKERLGKKMDVFVPEETWSKTKTMIDMVLAGESFSGIETRRYTKEENIINVSLSGAIYRDQDGNPAGSVINIRDISEQKKIEAQLIQSQRMEAVYTLAGGIAHDFNNLLSGIYGRTSLITMDIDSSHPHFEHIDGINEYVKSAEQLTKQLLGFARGGKYELKLVDINEIVERSSRMFGRTKKEIRVYRKNQKNIWVVEVDPGQIEQVLLNIYVNAWHAMPGGGNLYIQTENVIIDENYIKPYRIELGKYIKISVTDTGIGMDEATQQRIFEPFFTTKEMGRGTGLGLASVYGIIKNHGGFINVYSEKGVGTTFNFYLPASKDQVLEQKKVLDKPVLKGSETILLVDDEDLIIDVSQDILKLLGYNVLVAKDGKEAIQAYKKNQDKIDIVILDMIMPGMNGGEVYNKMIEINPDIKVLLSSGYSLNEQSAEILERGCNDFIQKPFNMMDISEKIRKILDN